MKRKSLNIPITITRHTNKHKTIGTQPSKITLKDPQSHRWSQAIVSTFLKQITSNVQDQINQLAHRHFIDGVMNECEAMGESLFNFLCPNISDQGDVSVVADQQPQRVAYDPICGFDKLVTKKNEFSQQSIKDHSFMSTKSNNFGRNHGKNYSMKHNGTGKLIPLDNQNFIQTDKQAQEQKQESTLRDRIFNTVILPSLQDQKIQNPKSSKQGNEILKPSQSQNDEFSFDYNGQKSTLLKLNSFNTKSSQSNVLRTTCRILGNQKQDEFKKNSIINQKNKRVSNFDLRRISKFKEIIKNPNLRNTSLVQGDNSLIRYGFVSDGDHGQMVKTILQSSFRKKQVTIKAIEIQRRQSKLL